MDVRTCWLILFAAMKPLICVYQLDCIQKLFIGILDNISVFT